MTDRPPPSPGARLVPLRYEDELLATIDLPGGALRVMRGIGSGLATGPDGRVWAVGDRGPNLAVALAVRRYGLDGLERHRDLDGAKVMPCPAIGPAISELRIDGDAVAIVRTIPLLDRAGRPVSGLPIPGGDYSRAEPAIDIDGERIAPDPSGVDSEGVAVLPGGGFIVGDEYGPSLLRVGAGGEVLARWVPEGCGAQFAGAGYPVEERLPAIAARRRLNRGFEALALSPDGARLFLAFQSPLSHPDDAAHERGTVVRLWALDATDGQVAAQWLYPLDPPESFARDAGDGAERSDVKVSEIAVVGPDRLLVFERVSKTTKLYLVDLAADLALDPSHLDPATRPTAEELSATGRHGLPVLAKRLLLSTDDHPEVDADLEGLAILDPRTLLLVNDNDFGIEGVATRFWLVELADEL